MIDGRGFVWALAGGILGGLLGAGLSRAVRAAYEYLTWEHHYFVGPGPACACFHHPRADRAAQAEAEQFGAFMRESGLRPCGVLRFWATYLRASWRWPFLPRHVRVNRTPPWQPGGAPLPGFGRGRPEVDDDAAGE